MAREQRLRMSIKDLEDATYDVLLAAKVALDIYAWSDLQDEIDRAHGGR